MENEPKCEIDEYGIKRWKLNGNLHREDGPAIEWDEGSQYWYKHDLPHRLDGPAVIQHHNKLLKFHNKPKIIWFINGHNVTDEIRTWAKDNDIDLDNLTEDDKLLIKLVWADYGR